MASIVDHIERNVATINNSISTINIGLGVTIGDLSRAELVFDVKAGQSTATLANMCITGRLTSTSNVRFERGGTGGVMVVHFHVIEYTAASGIVVHRGSSTLSTSPKNIALSSLAKAKCYSRVTMKVSSGSGFKGVMITDELTSDTNLQLVGDAANSNLTFDWQRIYIPDCTVHHFTGLATGTSYNVSLSGLGIVKEQSFCLMSMYFGGASTLDNDEFKGANLSSDSQCNIYSHFADSHNFSLQIVHRSKNRVERNYDEFSTPSFVVNWLDPVDWDESYINLPAPYNYFCPATFSNNAADFMIYSQLNGDFAITIAKFRSGETSKVVSEVIYLDGNPAIKMYYTPYWTFGGTGGK